MFALCPLCSLRAGNIELQYCTESNAAWVLELATALSVLSLSLCCTYSMAVVGPSNEEEEEDLTGMCIDT